MESLSPRLMLSSDFDVGRSGTETPIISADSRRVDTEDLRRWWEVGRCCFGGAAVDMSLVVLTQGAESEIGRFDIEERELTEVFRECERECVRPWAGLERLRQAGGMPGPILKDSN